MRFLSLFSTAKKVTKNAALTGKSLKIKPFSKNR
jgi:hypothetical protein